MWHIAAQSRVETSRQEKKIKMKTACTVPNRGEKQKESVGRILYGFCANAECSQHKTRKSIAQRKQRPV